MSALWEAMCVTIFVITLQAALHVAVNQDID